MPTTQPSPAGSYDPAGAGDAAPHQTAAPEPRDVRPASGTLILQIRDTLREIREHDHPRVAIDNFCDDRTAWLGEKMAPVLARLDAEQAETRKWQQRHIVLADEFTAEAARLTAERDRYAAVYEAARAWRQSWSSDPTGDYDAHVDALVDAVDAVDALDAEQAETRTWQQRNAALADEFTAETDRLAAELDRVRAVAQQYRDTMISQHEWAGHLIAGECKPCIVAGKTYDPNDACDQYQQWQREYEAAIGTYLPDTAAPASVPPAPAQEQPDVDGLLANVRRSIAAARDDSERAEAIEMLLSGWHAAWPASAVTDPYWPLADELVRLLGSPARAQETDADLVERLAAANRVVTAARAFLRAGPGVVRGNLAVALDAAIDAVDAAPVSATPTPAPAPEVPELSPDWVPRVMAVADLMRDWMAREEPGRRRLMFNTSYEELAGEIVKAGWAGRLAAPTTLTALDRPLSSDELATASVAAHIAQLAGAAPTTPTADGCGHCWACRAANLDDPAARVIRAALDWRARAARGDDPNLWADHEDFELLAAVDALLAAPACVDLSVPAVSIAEAAAEVRGEDGPEIPAEQLPAGYPLAVTTTPAPAEPAAEEQQR